MSPFNPFNYSLAELQKLVVQLISVAMALAVLFVTLDPGLGPALAAVAAAVFGVIGVFAAPNINSTDATKAVTSLAGSVIAVVALLGGEVSTDTEEEIGTLVALAIPPLLVFLRRNEIPAHEVPVEEFPPPTTMDREGR